MAKTIFVKDLKDKDPVNEVFLVKYANFVTTTKNGRPYLNVILSDKTGDLESRAFDQAEALSRIFVKNHFVKADGRVQTYQGRKQLLLTSGVVVGAAQVDTKDYFADLSVDVEALWLELLGFARSLENGFCRQLALDVLTDEDISQRLRIAPAAKSVHHAHRGGLLEHIVSISKLLDGIAKHYGPTVSRDLLLLGGFFHDIAKLWELEYDLSTDYTDEGRFLGHLIMGIELIERKAARIENFPTDLKLIIKHLIAAHHGELEFGSPKRPKLIEALIVHYVDDLDSKINAIQTFIDNDNQPGKWTALNKSFGRYFYKGPKVF
jgi:3'-5' exoribonuclease